MATAPNKADLIKANTDLVLENSDLRAKISILEKQIKELEIRIPGYQPQVDRPREFRTSFQGRVVPGSEQVNQDRPSFELQNANGYSRRVIATTDAAAQALRDLDGTRDVNFVCQIKPTGMWVKGVGVETVPFIIDGPDPYAGPDDTFKKCFGISDTGSRLKILSVEADGLMDKEVGDVVSLTGTFRPIRYEGKFYTLFYTKAVLDITLEKMNEILWAPVDPSREIPF
ncbi:MAG: hypothetical protein ABJN42_00625 [Roseibium sp.]|uniref:hypothetical protein n=1 Tax=Roseibium sp. TaxID=1936156 RepID=UPI00329824BC